MNNKPTKIEAEHDLTDIDQKLAAMHEIMKWAEFLSNRIDCNAPYYKFVRLCVAADIKKGNQTRDKIIKYLKTL